MREIDFSKDPDTLFKESVKAFNNNDYDKSLLILQYLNYIIPNNKTILTNLIPVYFKTYTEPMNLTIKNFNVENKQKNILSYILSDNCEIDIINNFIVAILSDSTKINDVLMIYKKHGSEKNIYIFILYFISIMRFDIISNLSYKITNLPIQNIVKYIPIRYVFKSKDEILNLRNNYINALDYILENEIKIESNFIINPMLYFSSYHGYADIELYTKYNKLVVRNNPDLHKNFFEESKDYKCTAIDQYLKNIHESVSLYDGTLLDEYTEQRLCAKYINPNDKVLEIGGNIGRVSLILSNLLKNDTNLVVLESDEKNATKLNYNREQNNRKFYIVNGALSKEKLYQYGWKTYSVNDMKNLDLDIQNQMVAVKTFSFNEIQSKYSFEFNTLVLDCEGAFYYILQDDETILKNITKIIIENDYSCIEHKEYVRNILKKYRFNVVDSIDLDPVYYIFHPNKEIQKEFYQVFIRNNDVLQPQRKINVGFVQPYYDTDSHSVSCMSNKLINNIGNNQIKTILINNTLNRDEIAKMKLDILVYITIGTDEYTHKLSYSRLAPVQCNFWGHINTSGKEYIDYYITSKLFDSEQQFFSEKLVKFNSLSTCLSPNEELKNIFLPHFKKKHFFGLPENKLIIFYPHTIFKIHPDCDDIIKLILKENSDAILVIFISDNERFYKTNLLERFEKNLGNYINQIRIINPLDTEDIHNEVKEYIINDGGNKSRFYYHNMIYLSDVLLDSFPFGGCITVLDSFLWNKIMITNPNIVRAKFTSGFYKKMGLTDLIPNNWNEFTEITSKLLNNEKLKKYYEDQIKHNKNKLYNNDAIDEWREFLISISNQ